MPNDFVWNGAEVKADFDLGIDRALTLSAITIEGKAVRLVPVDQGVLESSITYVLSGSSKNFPDAENEVLVGGRQIKAEKGEAIIGTVVFYAVYVEMGTRFQSAQAFLFPAYRGSWPEIKQFFDKEMKGIKWLH